MMSVFESTWAAHEAFRRLGFPADNIYVVTSGTSTDVWVQVRQGELTFDLFSGSRGSLSATAFGEQWQHFATDVNEGNIPSDALENIYQTWIKRLDIVALLHALGRRGMLVHHGTH